MIFISFCKNLEWALIGQAPVFACFQVDVTWLSKCGQVVEPARVVAMQLDGRFAAVRTGGFFLPGLYIDTYLVGLIVH